MSGLRGFRVGLSGGGQDGRVDSGVLPAPENFGGSLTGGVKRGGNRDGRGTVLEGSPFSRGDVEANSGIKDDTHIWGYSSFLYTLPRLANILPILS